MSKSVLVINTPDSCRCCRVKYDSYGECDICAGKDLIVDNYVESNTKPDWCPLVSLPEKLEESKYSGYCMNQTCTQYEKGFNICLDKISKGAN